MNCVFIDGRWRASRQVGTFHAENPATGESIPGEYPISAWADCDAALDAARAAAAALRSASPAQIAQFLTRFAERLETRKANLVEQAHLESALAVPRLADVELPRTIDQFRQAADAVLDGSWALPTIDTKLNLRSMYEPLGPIVVFGPNNFPFAYSGVAGGDFASAIAAGNPVIAKGHPLHPGTARMLGEEAFAAVQDTGLPRATVQLLYHMEPESGLRLVSDPRVGATAFTGGREGGLKLKAAADAAGKPIYLEMSSINPVVVLPGALAERGEKVAEEFTGSALLGGGQFCTNPGLVLLLEGAGTERFIAAATRAFETSNPPPLLSRGVVNALTTNVQRLQAAGAHLVTGGTPLPGAGARHANTLLRVSGDEFLSHADALQTEAFGSASLLVVARDAAQAAQVVDRLSGNLTGSIYSDTRGADDDAYAALAPRLRERVGRLLNDKMPTGVAVNAAMNHGGPYPATGHPGFSAVGFPGVIRRFAALQSYDHVRPSRLPAALQNKNPNGRMWRLVDGHFTQADI